MLPEWCAQQMRESATLDAIAAYIQFIFEEGDWMNDALADVPECGRHLVMSAGQLLALAMGFS
jgi:hypothetical protein